MRDVRYECERGFTLLETTIVLAILSACLLAFATLGTRPPSVHSAALTFQGAVVEARALAMANAGLSAPGQPASGATVSVMQNGASSVVYVYRSRPIPGSAPLMRDSGIPPIHLGAALTLPNATTGVQPFSVFISSAGYASVVANYAYDPAAPQALASDPGCDETDGVAITLTAGGRSESHALDCRMTAFEATTPLAPSALARANATLGHRPTLVPLGFAMDR